MKFTGKILALWVVALALSPRLLAQTRIPAGEINCRDPFITVDREKGEYYLIVSRRGPDNARLFAYKSKDLELWDAAGYVYHMPEGYKCPDDWWAPDTYFYKGKYYCFVTVSGKERGILRGTTVLRSDNGPLGPYKNIVPDDRMFITPPGMQCLDAALHIDEEGQPWSVFCVEWNGPNVVDSVGEIWCQRLNHELNGTVGEPVRLFSAADGPWARDANGRPMVTDASYVWRDEESGKLIMLWSSFGPKYSIGQAVSKTGKITGPWVHEKTPIFTKDGGHQMVFRDLEGKLRMSFHLPNRHPCRLAIREMRIENGKFLPVD